MPTIVTGPAIIGHVGSQNLTTFQNFVTRTFLLQYGIATQFSEIVHNLTGFPTHLTELKYYISVLRYVSSNHMAYFSPHALFSQAWSQLKIDVIQLYMFLVKLGIRCCHCFIHVTINLPGSVIYNHIVILVS